LTNNSWLESWIHSWLLGWSVLRHALHESRRSSTWRRHIVVMRRLIVEIDWRLLNHRLRVIDRSYGLVAFTIS